MMIRTTINMEGRPEGRLYPFCYWQPVPDPIRPVDLDPNRLNWMHEYPRDTAIYLPRHRKRRLMGVVYVRRPWFGDYSVADLWATPSEEIDPIPAWRSELIHRVALARPISHDRYVHDERLMWDMLRDGLQRMAA